MSPAFCNISFTTPVDGDKTSATIPVTTIQDKKCGKYDTVCTNFFACLFLTSLSINANPIEQIKPSDKFIKLIAKVFLSTFKNTSSENKNLN